MMLALNLLAVLCQGLMMWADGNGRIAALEIMINSRHIQQLLEKGDTLGLQKAIAKSGSFYRMQTFNQALANQVHQQLISKSDALQATFNPDDLNLLIRGIASAQVDAMTPGMDIAASAPPAPEPEPEPEPAKPEPPPKKGDDPFKKLKVTRGFQF